MENKSKKRYLYIATNPCLYGFIKIGITNSINGRKATLSNTSVLEDFEFVALFECQDAEKNEKALHKAFAAYRHYTRTGRETEFFSADKLDEVLSFARTSLPGSKEITPNSTKKRRNNTTFAMLNIPIGAKIYYMNCQLPACTGIVMPKNKVQFPGFDKPESVSKIAGKLAPADKTNSLNGYQLFYYNNKTLEELRPNE